MTVGTAHASDWRAVAACLHADSDLFFPISAAGPSCRELDQAKAFCSHCPVRRQCLEFAQANAPVYGIWGGTTLEERQRIRRREQRAARAQVRATAGSAGHDPASRRFRAGTRG
jgi:WhiB family transcriptional regulator, redox-sensing transcriptional regulator